MVKCQQSSEKAETSRNRKVESKTEAEPAAGQCRYSSERHHRAHGCRGRFYTSESVCGTKAVRAIVPHEAAPSHEFGNVRNLNIAHCP